ncbi:MAG: hypothetical protein HY243_00905 [Proteobacteria bacterium]|nr:hypothetical protein [Pseudomonadota bacterium]
MRFLAFYTPAQAPAAPPSAEHMAAMGRFAEDRMKAGVLISTGGLASASGSARVRFSKGEFAAAKSLDERNGPKSEGYAMLECTSLEEAIEEVKHFLQLAGDGECLIRPVGMPSSR